MPLMGWNAFCDAHHRPFLIRAHFDATAPQVRLDTLERFVKAVGPKGNFALCQGEKVIRAAFELEADAVQAVRILKARNMGRDDEWAGQWALFVDGRAMARITTDGATA